MQPSFSVEEAYFYPAATTWGAGFWCGPHPHPIEVHSSDRDEWMLLSFYSCSTMIQLPGTSGKRAPNICWHSYVCRCHQGTPLDGLALVTIRAYTSWPHRTVTNRERVLNQLSLPEHCKKTQTQDLHISVKGVYELIFTAVVWEAVFYLNTPKGTLHPLQRPQRLGITLATSLGCTPDCT